MLAGLVKKLVSRIGGCVSKPNRKKNGHKRRNKKTGKRGRNISTSLPDISMKRLSNAGNPVGDFSLNDLIRLDSKGASASCRLSEVSSMKFHLTQLKYHSRSLIDANGT